MEQVLKQILDADPGKNPSWLNDCRTYVENLAKKAPEKFDEAFRRWRELYSSAHSQLKEANRGSESHGIPSKARRRYRALAKQAEAQILILEDGRSKFSSDFFTYRYLATEGFLPGYNFPRLPLYAYVPGDGQKGTFLSRSRFFGISEFGPGNVIYHEGRAYRVVKAKLPLGHAGERGKRLHGEDIHLCSSCGACHEKEYERCHVCNKSLADKDLVKGTLIINSVEAISAERITANDEERVRRGYEIQTVFSWPENSSGQYQVDEADFLSNGKLLFTLQYANGAQIRRINKGLKRRKDKKVYGFNINPESGWWVSAEDEKQGDITNPEKVRPERIVPIVQERKNALLLKFNDPSRLSIEAKATIQHALLRGIEVIYQLEQGEVLGEPLPSREIRRTILIYEATEGGAGVLKRLIEDKEAISRVAKAAMKLMHFDDIEQKVNEIGLGQEIVSRDLEEAANGDGCVHGCYRCLLSYYNQPDHEIIERNHPEVVQFLFGLATGELVTKSAETESEGGNEIKLKWLQQFSGESLPVPDNSPIKILGFEFEFSWSKFFVAATTDSITDETRNEIEKQGWRIVRLPQNPQQGVPQDLVKELKGL